MTLIKIRPKKLKVYGKDVDFHRPLLPPKAYGLYTRENVDIYGQPLSMFF